MMTPDVIIEIPIADLERRFRFMLSTENFEFEDKLKQYRSLADVLEYPFEKLPLYYRLKESIRRTTVHKLTNLEHYLKYVVFNYTEPVYIQPSDYELILYFNTKLLSFMERNYGNDYKLMLQRFRERTEPAFWFDKSIKFWLNASYK